MMSSNRLDFEALLSREYRPARVTCMVARDIYKPLPQAKKTTDAGTRNGTTDAVPSSSVGSSSSTAVLLTNQSQQQLTELTKQQRQLKEETSRLVLSLVTKTPAFTRHLPEEAREAQTEQNLDLSDLPIAKPPAKNPYHDAVLLSETAFHEIELGDWESKINWEGYCEKDDDDDDDDEDDKPQKQETTKSNDSNKQAEPDMPTSSSAREALALLKRPRNPFLDTLQFDESTVCWDGDPVRLLEMAARTPLILELGIAGQSVARHVYQNTVLSAQRPVPALKSEAYQRRMDRDWSQQALASGDLSSINQRGSLHADKEKMEALIEARQQKRAQMAKDKTNRVKEAMGTLALGGGRGRTITSSLMGPGGTERTGRPSRHMVNTASHDTEYIEHLDMVNNHSLVRDLSKILQRQYHRPKLPLSVVRQDLCWQFQIRYLPGASKKGSDVTGGAAAAASSYSAMMMGTTTQIGAVSKAKLRNENDLSPTEGCLVLLEYCEERPPIQLTKGMPAKIVNYFRGDKSRCPVSAGGGDRPARRKRAGEGGASGTAAGNTAANNAAAGKSERPPRLQGPNQKTTVTDWVGKLPKKSQKDRSEKEAIDVLPEGITEVLHPKVHGPFIGEIEEGNTLTGLITNLFVAPMFRHEPESTDFLMILTPPGGAARAGRRDAMKVVLRDLPSSVFCVGQSEPRVRVYAPNTQGEKNFIGPFVSYQIARAISRAQSRDGHGLRFDELQDRVLPYLDLPANALRQRLKQVAVYDKNTQIWTTKAIGFEDYPGVEALGKTISPEGVAAFETACHISRRLTDLGIHHLYSGSHTVASVGVTMVYLTGKFNSTRELQRKVKKLGEVMSRSSKGNQSVQAAFYERAAAELDTYFKMLRQKHEAAQFIFEQLQLAPWHLTGEFIEVHKKAEGTGMMKLTGLGDPSGQGEGFSFLREVDSKPNKSLGNAALTAQVKKITGTEDDLRKLTMKQMAALLRSYGLAQKYIDNLKRWDRVHVIRDLSTKAASDGTGGDLERFARGEKMKLSEQKQNYRNRIQEIWKRQIAALSSDSGEKGGGGAEGGSGEAEADAAIGANAQNKNEDDSDSDPEDDDEFLRNMEDEMLDNTETAQILTAHAIGTKESEGGFGQLRAVTQDKDLNKEARELAALKRQRDEERAAQEGFQSANKGKDTYKDAPAVKRKVIRRKITRTHPDGRQTITFKFILHPDEVGKVMARLANRDEDAGNKNKEWNYEYGADERPPGHCMFEDEDDFDYSTKGNNLSKKRRGAGAAARRQRPAPAVAPPSGKVTPKAKNNLQFGKLKKNVSKEERMRKRKREEEELEVYSASAKRKGTNNRKERGSIRERRPHVIFAEKLESIRAAVEARPNAGPFLKPVNRRLIPRYYEVISNPIDLQTIRDRISRYEYRSADTLVSDVELMKKNAIKFNGDTSPIAKEAVAIYEFVRDQVEASRDEFSKLEEAVAEQMSGKPKKKIKGKNKKSNDGSSGQATSSSGVSVNLGDLSTNMLDGIDSDSGDDNSINLD